MEHNGVARRFEILHGVRQQVAGNALRTVFYDLAAKGLLQLHLSTGGCRQIPNAPATKAVGHKSRREVIQIAPAGQADQQPIVPPVHLHLANTDAIVFLNHLRGGIPKRVPELHDVWVGSTPRVHQRLHFLFGHLRAHAFNAPTPPP